MTEAHKTPSSASSATASSLSYSVRRMRNTAVLVKWIEDHQSNPYPTKAEKQYLAYYSGMNLTQLSTWFANARRRIKKIGMKTWLEGRSTFSLEPVFPPTASFHQRSSTDYSGEYVCLYLRLCVHAPTMHAGEELYHYCLNKCYHLELFFVTTVN